LTSPSPAPTDIERCDVAIVGAGLAGMLAAHRLRDHAHVVLIDASDGPASAASRSLGIAAAGGMDSPARLALGLGERPARQLWEWSRSSVDGLPGLDPTGSLRVCLDSDELDEWRHSADLIQTWTGQAPEPVEPPGTGFEGAYLVAGDGTVDVGALMSSRATAVRVGRARVSDPSSDGVTLALDDGSQLTAELLIIAAGAGCASVHPWFGPMLYPVRIQGLRTQPLERRWTLPVLARHRFEGWLQEPDGRLAFVGCRWGEQPEMEAGVVDDTTISETVRGRQAEFLARHLDVDVTGAETWTGICAFGCDGLPLVGPLPGSPRIIALAGWGGWGLSMIGQAVTDVCEAVLGREGRPVTPPLLAPRRMT
jgi:glycine/D-amino acid oxidase-like deaminating enzyme